MRTGGRDLILLVVFFQEANHLPVGRGKFDLVDLRHGLGCGLVPVLEVAKITFCVGLELGAGDFYPHLTTTRSRVRSPPPARRNPCSRPVPRRR